MNDGFDGPVETALRETERRNFEAHPLNDKPPYRHNHPTYQRHYNYVRGEIPQGVTVHRAYHNDESQVICSTHGRRAIAAHELPYAIERGYLSDGKYREESAEAVAKELHDLAKRIRKSIRDAKKSS
jgi:hypothetical protein